MERAVAAARQGKYPRRWNGKVRAAGFPYPDPEASQKQLGELRGATQGRHHAPDCNRSSDNIAPVVDIRPTGNGHSQRRVDEGMPDPRAFRTGRLRC